MAGTYDFITDIDDSLRERDLPAYTDILARMNSLAFYVKNPHVRGYEVREVEVAEQMMATVLTMLREPK